MIVSIALGILAGYVLIKIFDIVMPKIIQKLQHIPKDKIKSRWRAFWIRSFGTKQGFKKDMKQTLKDVSKMWILGITIILLILIFDR